MVKYCYRSELRKTAITVCGKRVFVAACGAGSEVLIVGRRKKRHDTVRDGGGDEPVVIDAQRVTSQKIFIMPQ